jgi:polyisoprenoid-binding protein YceI
MITTTPALFDTGVWRVDPARSHVGFSVGHLRFATVQGRFRAFSGRLASTDHGVRIDARVSARSVDTGDGARDRHLRDDLFAAARWPAIEFGAYCGAPAPDEDWYLLGTLTIRDVARPIVLRATTEPLADDDVVRVALEGEFSGAQFGLVLREGDRLLAGDTVRVSGNVVLRRDPGSGLCG